MFIRVIDVETTDFEPDGKVCEVGWTDIRPSQVDMDGNPTVWEVGPTRSGLIDPGVPIPATASALHHITDHTIAAERAKRITVPAWDRAAPVALSARQSDPAPHAYAAHNAKFERFFCARWTGDVPWICTYKAALRIWPDAPGHSLQVLRYWLGMYEDHGPAHRAGPDTRYTAFVLAELLGVVAARRSEASLDHADPDHTPVRIMAEWANNPALQVTCWLGNWCGKPWREVDAGFLEWVLGKDFDADVIYTARTELDKRRRETDLQYQALLDV